MVCSEKNGRALDEFIALFSDRKILFCSDPSSNRLNGVYCRPVAPRLIFVEKPKGERHERERKK